MFASSGEYAVSRGGSLIACTERTYVEVAEAKASGTSKCTLVYCCNLTSENAKLTTTTWIADVLERLTNT